MDYIKFQKIILALRDISEDLRQLYSKKIDLINFVEPYDSIIAELLKEIYGEQGYEWIAWYCYEKDFGRREDLTAHDENNNPICYDLKSLWEYVEKTYKII
jgi:hypothetical protein